MKNIRIEDLSAIQERRAGEESKMELEESKRQYNVTCPFTHKENYDCPICHRLRLSCPFNRTEVNINNRHLLNISQNISTFSKQNASTTIGERQKTFSTFQSRNRPNLSFQNQFHQSQIIGSPINRQIRVQPPRTIVEEIYFVPHIHNHIIVNKGLEKTPAISPTRRKKGMSYIQINQETILTPTQFKDLMHSYKNV